MIKSRALPALLLLALCLRLGWGLSRPTTDGAIDALPDQREYLSIAQNILGGHGVQFVDRRFAQTVYAYRMPGYPLLIALCGGSVRAVRALQALLDTSTVLAVFLLSRRLLDGTDDKFLPSISAAALVALNPFFIYFSALILSETLFIAMMTWGMLLLLGPVNDERHGRLDVGWLGGVLLLVLSIYARPSAIALPVILAAGALVLQKGHLAAGLAFVVALIVAALFPWAQRNARTDVLGQWIWTTTNGGITAYDGWNLHADGGSNQTFVRQMPELAQMGEIERSRYLGGLARRFVVENPARAIELAAIKLGRIWSPIPLSDQFGSMSYQAFALVYAIPFDLLLLAGLIKGRLRPTAKVFLLIPAIYLTVAHVASVGSLRYLLPAVGPMAVVAGSCIPWLRRDCGRI
jgi:hypothetical protein